MSNRFDFEQELLDCWRVTTDVKDVYDYVMEHSPDTDSVANALLGVHALYEIKFNKLWSTFEQLVSQRQL